MSKRSRASRPASSTPSTPPKARGGGDSSGTGAAPGGGGPNRAGSASGGSGRRARASAGATRPPLERFRGAIIGVVVAAVVVVGGAFVFLGSTAPAYACATVLDPETPASPEPGATPRLGQATQDLGRRHADVGARVTYEFCPPTSGSHYNDSRYGPIAPRFYGTDDRIDPQGWIHNLEHGQMTVLYRCPEGCDETAQASLRLVQQELPLSPLCRFPATTSVAVARFDDLPTPYAAVVWGRVLFLDTLDTAKIATFAAQSADRGPEPQCQAALPGASPSGDPSANPSVGPSASPPTSPSATAAPTPAP